MGGLVECLHGGMAIEIRVRFHVRRAVVRISVGQLVRQSTSMAMTLKKRKKTFIR